LIFDSREAAMTAAQQPDAAQRLTNDAAKRLTNDAAKRLTNDGRIAADGV
jgi:hypothetical protein